jgi:hypothetical protein
MYDVFKKIVGRNVSESGVNSNENFIHYEHVVPVTAYLNVFHCCAMHVASVISLIFQLMHTLYTLEKINIKTLKNLPLHVSVQFLRASSEGSWTVLCQITKLRSVDIRSLENCAVCGRMSLQSVCVCVWCSLLSKTLSWSRSLLSETLSLSHGLHDKVSLSKEHQKHTQTD